MIPKTITITLPVMSAHDAAEIGRRAVLLDGYVRAMASCMGLAPYDALQPAALLAGTHGLNNELADKQADVVLGLAELLRNFHDVAHDLKKAALFASEVMGRVSEN